MFSFFGGGHGGHSAGDGLSHGNADLHGDDSAAGDPGGRLSGALHPMGAAAGLGRRRHRGGLGAIYEIELLEDSAEAFIFGERGRSSP